MAVVYTGRFGFGGFGPRVPDIENIDFERVWCLPDSIFPVIFRHVRGRQLLALEESCRRFRKVIRFGMKDRIPKISVEDITIYGDEDETSNFIYVYIGDRLVADRCTPDILKT